jgi:hypothetical protein
MPSKEKTSRPVFFIRPGLGRIAADLGGLCEPGQLLETLPR